MMEAGNRSDSKDLVVLGWLSSEPTSRKRRSQSLGNENDPWGWFADFEPVDTDIYSEDAKFSEQTLRRTRSLPNPVTEPPQYILESSLAFQQLWYETAGRRPRQPREEREYFEKIWEQNFQKSGVEKKSQSQTSSNREVTKQKVEDGEVLFRGEGPFSNAVSKCFQNFSFSSMRLQVPRFRIHKFDNGDVCAEYLVVISLDHLTFGVWKRHSDFKKLVNVLYTAYEHTEFEFKNTILSWKCLLHKQRWFRCLDKVRRTIDMLTGFLTG